MHRRDLEERQQKHIVLIITHTNPLKKYGGAERFVYSLMLAYRSKNNIIPVTISMSMKEKFRIVNVHEIGYIIYLPTLMLNFVSVLPLSIRGFYNVIKLLKHSSLIHLVYPEGIIYMYIGIIGKLLKKKIVTSSLAIISWMFHHSIKGKLLGIFITEIKFILTALSDAVHVASLYDKYYVEKINSNVFIIPHGIDSMQPNIPTSRIISNKLEKNTYYIAFLGRFTEAKGAYVLLEALNKLLIKGINVKLLVIGPRYIALHTLLKYAKKNPLKYHKIKKYILITGYVKEQEKYLLLNKCKIGVIPSISDTIEAFSYALSEFNVVGIPVVACNVGAIRTRLIECAGRRITPCTPENLVEAIVTFLEKEKKGKVCRLPDMISTEKERMYYKFLIHKLQE